MAKNKIQISHLNYGELHIYYPVKFDTKLSFSILCNTLYKSSISFNEEYQEKIMNSLGTSLSNATNDFQQQISESDIDDTHITLKVRDTKTNKVYQPLADYESDYEIDSDNIRFEFLPSDSSVSLNIVSTELEALQQRLARMEKEFDLSSKIYGDSFTLNQKRILMLPFKAKLTNGKFVWLHAILIVFSNKMGVLKLELPLIDADVSPLKEYNIDSLVNSIDNCWKINNVDSDIKLSDLPNHYLKSIVDNNKVNIIKYNGEIRNILFIDFDEMPNQINSMSTELQEELFRIISAPVPDYSYTSYSKDAREHMIKYSWGNHGMKYIIKTNGGVLSLIDKNLLNYYISEFKAETNTSVLDNDDYTYMCNLLANDINTNIEFAILIIMLKKTNVCNNIYNKTQKRRDLFKIRKEYYQNILFINELQNTCYGTVIEQTSQIEKMMPLYLKTEINNSNQTALDNILKDEDQKKNEHFLNFISIGSLMLSLIFGLPSIYEALIILHKVFYITNNIPYITLENFSVVLWLLLNIFIIIKLLLKR
ncbi:MAG: hypothetical protein NC225_06905 [Clostridium sp.]|nr:hypothetical protein [Clostridium sp.]MCM1459220.1 hypothetical protein [Bacteroides sp.]